MERNDVCVVGGGIAGLSVACMRSAAGKTVALLEDGGLCEGMTQYTTGHLASASVKPLYDGKNEGVVTHANKYRPLPIVRGR